MTCLICRFGGIGDGMCITPIGKEFKRRGYEVTFAVMESQVMLFDNLIECFDKVVPIRRIMGQDSIPNKFGWISLDSIKPNYTIVIDYKNSVENNSLYNRLPYGAWVRSMNSNYQNWSDISFAWANIDPSKILNNDKRPIYKVKDDEKEWASKFFTDKPVIGIHLEASSLSRTWYYPGEIVKKWFSKYKDYVLFVYIGNNTWKMVDGNGEKNICNVSIRQSIALIENMKCLVCVDSSMSHIAEAICVPHITIYSTVPAWTREKYYKYSCTLEPNISCSPCFNLDKYCPENKKKAEQNLTDREKKIEELGQKYQGDLGKMALELDTTHFALQHEINATRMRIEALSNIIPECIKSITIDHVVAKLEEILCLV